jgi:hypothetical protein
MGIKVPRGENFQNGGQLNHTRLFTHLFTNQSFETLSVSLIKYQEKLIYTFILVSRKMPFSHEVTEA